MKKNKNEKNEMPGINKNSKNDSGVVGNEENLPGTEYHFMPIDEELLVNETESDYSVNPVQNYSYSDIEKKQNENNPFSEKSEYPGIPFLVNLKPNISNHHEENISDEMKGVEQDDERDENQDGNNHHDS